MFIDSVYFVRFLVWGAVILFGWSAVAALLKSDLFAPFLAKWRGISRFQKGMIVSVLLAVTAWAGIKPGIGGDGGDDTGGSSTNDVTQVEGDASNTNDVGWIGGDADGTNDVDQVGGDTNSVGGVMLNAPRPMFGGAPSLGGRGSVVGTPVAGTEGFSLVSVGHDETFEFTPPETAVVATNWLLHGASTQPLRLSFDDWVFPYGGEGYSNFTVFAYGEIMPGEVNTNHFLVPFGASLGIAPMANWNMLPANEDARFWSGFSPSNTLLLTWQNALLDRAATNPVSFQAELKPSGGFVFRYDLSRLVSDEPLSNAVIMAQSEDANFADAPTTNLTSLAFHTHDEQLCDENREDFDEKIGDEDPYAYPEGSTNTVLEHVFYSGTTNGAFAYPQSTDGNAVLMVSVSGSGSGELLVGSKFVPLVGRPAPVSAPRLFAAPPPSPSTLAVTVPRGSTQKVYMRGDSTLSVSFSSEDFAFGALPDLSGRHFTGWINFPFVNATVPCIHDYNARKKMVSLPVGSGASELTCRWTGTSQIGVENLPPRSATITGHFSGRTTTPVSYTLDHPRYLFGQKTYSQTARYCPPPPEEDEDDEDHHGWGGGGYYDGEGESDPYYDDHEDDDWWEYDEDDDTESDPDPEEGDDEEASDDYPHVVNVLKIRDPLAYTAPIHLTVPDEHRNCCPCPDHASNWVAVVYQASRIKVVESDSGLDFVRSGESLDVQVAGVAPSSAIGDAELSIAANGDVCFEGKYTVLGVGIEKDEVDLELLNGINPDFGLPIPVTTNMSELTELDLKTLVRLPGGNIHVGFANVTGEFTVRYYDPTVGDYRVLVDSSNPSLDVSYERWRRMVGGSTDVYSSETPVYVTSSAAGSATLVYRYWGIIDDMYVEDEARQVISSVDPLVLADINRDGAIDDADAGCQIAGMPFRFWTNEDTCKGDYIGATNDVSLNASDFRVNGKLDLVNLFPVKVDLERLHAAWDGLATIKLRAWTDNLRYCVLGDLDSLDVSRLQTAAIHNVDDGLVESTALTPLDSEGVDLDDVCEEGQHSLMLAFEAVGPVNEWNGPEVVVSLGDSEVFSYRLPLRISSVDAMYRYLNLRGAESDSQFIPVLSGEPTNRPDDETDSKHFVFVHGFNVNADESREWARAMFKRLWWAGSRSKFTAVDWNGSEEQFSVPGKGTVCLNYYVNVLHAFMTAETLKNVCAQLPGEKVMLAHSLGNMLVSAAAKDYNLQYDKYYMLNAAVPMEAYDVDAGDNLMIDGAWQNLGTRFRASHFYEVFSTDVSDFRSRLSWKGRFAGIHDAINCYSPTDEVVGSFDTNKVLTISQSVWTIQELFKGTVELHAINLWPSSHIGCEGGWGINAEFVANPLAYLPGFGLFPSHFSDYAREDLITHPLFTSFGDSRMASTNALNIVDYGLRARMLGDAIPAESFATGANETGGLAGNYNVHAAMAAEWPKSDDNDNVIWEHSDVKNVAYYYLYQFFEKVLRETR